MPMTRDQLLQMHASARIYQQRYDDAFQSWGMRAKAMAVGDDIGSYRRGLAVQAKKLLPDDHKFCQVQYRALNDDAFSEYSSRNDSVPFDAPLRQVTETSENGTKIVKFLGQRSLVEDFKSIPRRVAYFRGNQGPVKTSGLPV